MSDDDKDPEVADEEQEEKPKPKKPRVKKEPVDISSINWAELAKNGEVEKQKLPALKAYCKQHDLPVGGNKPQLVQRILEHIGGGDKNEDDGDEGGEDGGDADGGDE